MATLKIKLRASSVRTREGTIVFQVIHRRVARQLATTYKLFHHEWDAMKSEVLIPALCEDSRRAYLTALKSRMLVDVSLFKRIMEELDRTGSDYSADDVINHFRNPSNTGGFVSFAEQLIPDLKRMGRESTAERYVSVLNSFKRFIAPRDDIPLDSINSGLMVEYENFLKSTGVCLNSISFYMRGLRAIYNRAADRELVVQKMPFRHVYTGIGKTVKRAIPASAIRRIRDMDLTLNPSLDFARDIFMFSFYTRGMSFIDIAYLKKKDLREGILSYRRRKTGQMLSIKWEKPMQEIVDKYDTRGTPFLLPVITNMEKDFYRQYKNAGHLINGKLKIIGKRLQLEMPLTTYVARHGWASIAKSKNIPISVISEAMGHESENTTRIYLASLDTSVVDNANSLILKSL